MHIIQISKQGPLVVVIVVCWSVCCWRQQEQQEVMVVRNLDTDLIAACCSNKHWHFRVNLNFPSQLQNTSTAIVCRVSTLSNRHLRANQGQHHCWMYFESRSGDILRSAPHLIIVLNRQGAQLNENGKGAIHCGQKELQTLLTLGRGYCCCCWACCKGVMHCEDLTSVPWLMRVASPLSLNVHQAKLARFMQPNPSAALLPTF